MGLLGACWICSKKPHRHLFIPEILPVCRCVVLVQQQCFAKLQSEMNQLARPLACQPSHSAKTDGQRSPGATPQQLLYILFLNYLPSHKYTQDKSEAGRINPTSPVSLFEVNDKKMKNTIKK